MGKRIVMGGAVRSREIVPTLLTSRTLARDLLTYFGLEFVIQAQGTRRPRQNEAIPRARVQPLDEADNKRSGTKNPQPYHEAPNKA